MRARFRLAVGGFLVLAAASEACTGSDPDLAPSNTDGRADGGGEGDASTDGGADGSKNGNDNETPHTGPVTVTVRRRSTNRPVSSIPLYFYDAKGNVLANRATNDVGQTSFEHPDIAAVTIASSGAFYPRFMTFLGVQAGDSLQWVDDDDAGDPVSFKVYAPPSQPGGTTLRLVLGSCSATVTDGDVSPPFERSCVAPGASTTPFLVAMNGEQPVKATSLRDVKFNEQSHVTLLSFVDGWSDVDTTPRILTATGLPNALTPGTSSAAIGLTHHLGADRGTMIDVAQSAVPSGASISFAIKTLAVPSATFRQDELAIVENLAAPSKAFLTRALAVRGPVTKETSLSLPQPLPVIRGVTVKGSTVPTFAFDADASISAMKGLVAVARWNIPSDLFDDAVGCWRIVAPPSIGPLTPPPLPAYETTGPSDPRAWREPVLAAFDGAGFEDYAAFRTSNVPGDAFTALLRGAPSSTFPVLAADGAVLVTARGSLDY